MCRTAH